MISQEEHQEIYEFLKKVGVNQIEIYQELYDHIATSYENRRAISEDLRTHIREEVQPSLGGVKGIQRIIKSQTKAFEKEIQQRAFAIAKSYVFGWPGILVTMVTISLVLMINKVWGMKVIATSALIFGVLSPPMIALAGMIIFYKKSLKRRLGPTTSLKNLKVMRFAAFGTTFINSIFFLIGGIVFRDSGWLFDQLVDNPILGLSTFVIFVLYGLVCLQLLKEKFQFKLVSE